MAQVAAQRARKAHVSKAKKAEVDSLVRMLTENNVVGLASIQGIPASSMLQMRRSMRGQATIKVTKNTLLRLALKEASGQKEGLDALAERIDGPTCVIATQMNPFRLYKKTEEAKSKAPARGGEKAPEDIWVRKGETPFKPGPIVGELQRSGIPAAIEEGKVVIKSDKLLVKAGDPIPANIAAGLTRLEIFPLTVGLDVKAVWEGGMVYGPDVLGIDQTKILADLTQGVRNAINLSVNAGYPTKQTIEIMIQKAHREAVALAVESAFPEPKALDMILGKANAQALAVARKLNAEAVDEDIKKKL
jgi:large subunit ribosomal protein L10